MNLPLKLRNFQNPELQRKLLWLLILATLCAVTLLIIPRVATQRPAIDSKLLTLRVMLCAVGITTLLNWKSLWHQPWRFLDSVFAALLAAFTSAALFSETVIYSVTETWQYAGLIFVSWTLTRLSITPPEATGFLWTAGGLGVVASLYGFLTYIGADILRPLYPFAFEENQAGGRNYIHSFFGNPEYFGGFAAPTAVVLWGLALQPRVRLWQRVAFATFTAFVLLVLGLSGSRGAFIGFLAGAALVFFGQVSLLTSRIKRTAWILFAASILMVGMGVIVLSTPNPLNPRDVRLAQRFADLTDTQSASIRERALFYTSTATAISENPIFGYGPGRYRLEFLENVKQLVDADPRAGTVIMLQELNRRLAEHAHNDYLEIWFEQGTLGFGAFLLLITSAGVAFSRRRWKLGTGSHSPSTTSALGLYTTTFAGVTTIWINALTSFPLHMPARATLAWLLTGVFFALDQRLYEADSTQPGITPEITTPEKDEN